jgi:hypothetical protein
VKVIDKGPPSKRKLYTPLPLAICNHPPIAHRGSTDDRALLPFEVAVLSAVLAEAWDARSHSNHLRAYEAAAAAIKRERRRYEKFREEWRATKARRREGEEAEAPTLTHTWGGAPQHKPIAVGQATAKAGEEGYWEARRKHRREPPPAGIEVLTSQHRLLRTAGLQVAKLLAALDRLLRPLDGAHYPRAPLLREWQRTKDGLRLLVDGEWLEPPFRKVPLPLPTSGASVLALYLFVFAIRPWRDYRCTTAGDFYRLCERLGLPVSGGKTLASRSIARACAGVNAHLHKLGKPGLVALARAGVDAPHHVEIMSAGNERVRIIARLPNWDAEDPVENVDRAADADDVGPTAEPEPVPRRRRSENRSAAKVAAESPAPPEPVSPEPVRNLTSEEVRAWARATFASGGSDTGADERPAPREPGSVPRFWSRTTAEVDEIWEHVMGRAYKSD